MAESDSQPQGRTARFAWFVVVLPPTVALAATVLAFASPRRDSDGIASTVAVVGFVLVLTTLIASTTEQYRADVDRRAPFPLALALGGAAATITLLTLSSSEHDALRFAAAALAAGVAAAAGATVVSNVVTTPDPPVVHDAAPADAIRRSLDSRPSSVWTGVAPSPARKITVSMTALNTLLALAMIALSLTGEPPVWGVTTAIMVWGAFAVSVPARYRAARVRLTVGPTGLEVRSGLTPTVYLARRLEHVESAWYTDAPAPNLFFTYGKRSNRKRLSFLTRRGPALLVRFTDGTDLVVSMDEPAEPASIINGLLDRRPTLAVSPTM